jgi:hypothetical protein
MKCKELLNECEPAMDHAIFMVKRHSHLHKQHKKIYKQHLTLRKENKILKKILQQLETKNKGKGELHLLAEAT